MVCYVIFWSGQACETDRKVMWVAVNPLLHGYQSLSMGIKLHKHLPLSFNDRGISLHGG